MKEKSSEFSKKKKITNVPLSGNILFTFWNRIMFLVTQMSLAIWNVDSTTNMFYIGVTVLLCFLIISQVALVVKAMERDR